MMASQFLKKGEAMFFIIFLCVLSSASFTNAADTGSFFDGEAYSKINAVQIHWAERLLKKIKENSHDSILDIGCGTAEITAELAQTFPKAKVHGIDPNASMLEWGRKKFKNYTNLTLIQASAPAYLEGCKPNTYSTIVSFSSLHWLLYTNLKKTIKAAHNELPSKGTCYFVLAGKEADGQQNFLTLAVNVAIKNENWVQFFDKDDVRELDDSMCAFKEDEFRALAIESGFTKSDVKLEKVTHIFPSIARFRQWLDGVSPYKKILGDKHAPFLDTVVQEYVKICPAGLDGSLSYPDYMIYAVLKKD